MKQHLFNIVLLLAVSSTLSLAQTGLQLTEIMFDVPSTTLGGDVNGDGTREAASDEFFELYNNSASDIDISH